MPFIDYQPNLLPTYYPKGVSEQEEPAPIQPIAPIKFEDIAEQEQPVRPTTTTSTSTTTTTTTTTTSTTTTTTTEAPLVIINNKEEEPLPPLGPPTTPKTLVTRPRPALNPIHQSCNLPVNPNYDVDFIEAGYRFYSLKYQRLEYNTLPVKLRKHYDISMTVRTSYPNGLLFYAPGEGDDLIAFYLLDGHVYHQVQVGAGIKVNISSEIDILDGEWHTLEFVRTNRKISLTVDGKEQPGAIELPNISPPVFSTQFPIYVGGYSKYVEDDLKRLTYLPGPTTNYNGCIKEIKFNGLALETEPTVYDVVPCTDQVETGVFFHDTTGYVKLFDRFAVNAEVTITFEFRPREPDGLLFSVHGRNSYLIIELVDNSLFFTVKSDTKNVVQTNFTLADNGSFCDGKWRTVQAIKSKFVITLAVDYVSSKPGVGNEFSVLTKTNRPLFMGGHHAFQKAPGIKTKKTFKGCIKNIQINRKDVRVTPNMVFGDIWQGACPIN